MNKDRIDEFLMVGEEVLWKGGPENYAMLDRTYRVLMLKKLLVSLGAAALLAAAYVFFMKSKNTAPDAAVIGIILACGLISPLSLVVDAFSIQRYRYAATDRRLLVYEDMVKQMDYRRIKEARFIKDGDGHVSLACGSSAVKAAPSKMRSLTVYGDVNEREGLKPCRNFAMYAVSDSEGLRKVLNEKIPSLHLE